MTIFPKEGLVTTTMMQYCASILYCHGYIGLRVDPFLILAKVCKQLVISLDSGCLLRSTLVANTLFLLYYQSSICFFCIAVLSVAFA